MFHQQELDFELLTDEVQQLESNYAELMKRNKTSKGLSYLSDSESSTQKRPAPTQSTQASFETPTQNQYTKNIFLWSKS